MVIGHLAPALLARTRHPGCSWILLVVATYAADLIEIGLSLVGFSSASAGQYSHSVPAVAAAGLLLTLAATFFGPGRQVGIALALIALSHIPLDWLTGETKPLFHPGGPTIGLNLYRIPVVDWVVEGALFVAAWTWWTRSHRPKRIAWAGAALLSLLVFQAALISYTASNPIISLFERAFAAAGAVTGL